MLKAVLGRTSRRVALGSQLDVVVEPAEVAAVDAKAVRTFEVGAGAVQDERVVVAAEATARSTTTWDRGMVVGACSTDAADRRCTTMACMSSKVVEGLMYRGLADHGKHADISEAFWQRHDICT